MTTETLITLPAHKCSLTISHNDHRDNYETLAESIESNPELYEFRDDEQRQRAIDTDECWQIQWYPDTPIGFFKVSAPTLQEALDYANEAQP